MAAYTPGARDISRSIVHQVLVKEDEVVAVPTLADNVVGGVNVTVTGAEFGDTVQAAPLAALPTNAHLISAFVSAADTVRLLFVGDGAVTGANVNFDVRVERRGYAV